MSSPNSPAGGSVKLDLLGARQLLELVKAERRFFHSIEGWRVTEDGREIADISLSKLGLRGEDDFTTLEQHHDVVEDIFTYAKTLVEPLIFEIWVSEKSFLPKKSDKE